MKLSKQGRHQTERTGCEIKESEDLAGGGVRTVNPPLLAIMPTPMCRHPFTALKRN